ncbi:methyltransferase [Streptomyces eurythermus]|uniref:methyltransferase n=1 Tax=Streptomyces eurythermus TaxID=42237 RepID=UPI0036D43B40
MSQATLDTRKLVVDSAPWVFQSLYVAAKLRLPDLLADGPRTAADLAAECEVHPQALYRFCRALAALGLFTEEPGERFTLTEAGGDLRSTAPGGLAHFVVVNGEESFRAWADVLYSVRTGLPAFEHVFGMSHFDFLAANAESSKSFNAMSGAGVPGVVAKYDFAGAAVIADVGGGTGGLLAQVLERFPDARGILQDTPAGVAEAEAFLTARGLADRVEVVGRSFFEYLPTGADVYVLSRVLHDWSDADCLRLLRALREAMGPDARIVVIDNVIPQVEGYHVGKFSDLQMLVVLGGRERTAKEMTDLLVEAGFAVTSTLTSDAVPGAPRSEALFEARPTGN